MTDTLPAKGSSAGFTVGDLIEAEGRIWEVVTPAFGDGDVPNPGVKCGEHGFMRRGRLIAYAVRAFVQRDYHEISPRQIRRGWRAVNTPRP